MATYDGVITINAVAGADLSASQGLLVAGDSTAGQVVLAGDGVNAIGVLLNAPASGGAAAVAISGKVRAVAGGTVTVGARVASDAAGKVVVAAEGDYVLGVAASAGAANATIEVYFDKNGIEPA